MLWIDKVGPRRVRNQKSHLSYPSNKLWCDVHSYLIIPGISLNLRDSYPGCGKPQIRAEIPRDTTKPYMRVGISETNTARVLSLWAFFWMNEYSAKYLGTGRWTPLYQASTRPVFTARTSDRNFIVRPSTNKYERNAVPYLLSSQYGKNHDRRRCWLLLPEHANSDSHRSSLAIMHSCIHSTFSEASYRSIRWRIWSLLQHALVLIRRVSRQIVGPPWNIKGPHVGLPNLSNLTSPNQTTTKPKSSWYRPRR